MTSFSVYLAELNSDNVNLGGRGLGEKKLKWSETYLECWKGHQVAGDCWIELVVVDLTITKILWSIHFLLPLSFDSFIHRFLCYWKICICILLNDLFFVRWINILLDEMWKYDVVSLLSFSSSLAAIMFISPRCSSIMKHDQSHLHGISFEFECDLSVVFSTLTHVWKSECLDRLAWWR